MLNADFTHWCHSATAQIKYRPDREAVAEELRCHMEDHYDALIAKGLSPEEASQQTLSAMGSAEDIAPQLAVIHTPCLGYIFLLVRALAVIAAVCAVYFGVATLGSFAHTLVSTRNFDFIPVNQSPLDYYCHPNVSDASDGYRFQITEAGYSKAESTLYFELEMIYCPWIDAGDIATHFWAIDSLGNFYDAKEDAEYDDPTRITGSGGQGSTLIFVYDMRITGFDTDAQWVELHYDRDGRDIVLHIDLNGGAEHA